MTIKLKSIFVAGIDIGGTKLRIGLFRCVDGMLVPQPVWEHTVPSGKGQAHLRSGFQTAVQAAQKWVQEQGGRFHPVLGVGSPGRLLGPTGRVARGTSPNLEAFSGEFDGLEMVPFLAAVAPGFTLVVENDAVVQMVAGIEQLLGDEMARPKLLGRKVAYVGPGTGLGGGFATVGDDGEIRMMTDGHICDLLIGDGQGGRIGAEWLLSGTAFERRSGVSPKEVNASPALLKKHLSDIHDQGLFLGEVMVAIWQGHMEKSLPDTQWSPDDAALVKGTTVFLLGGSFGTKGEIAAVIQKVAIAYAAQSGLIAVILPIHDADQAAMLGAAQLAVPVDR